MTPGQAFRGRKKFEGGFNIAMLTSFPSIIRYSVD